MDNNCQPYPTPSVIPSVELCRRYRCEGMSDLIVYHPPTPLNTPQQIQQAHQRLSYLLENMKRLVTLRQIEQTFSLVNALVANPLGKEEFEFKVNVIFAVFADKPACLFHADTSKKLATCSRFFPSGMEIKHIIEQQEQAYRQEIETLRQQIKHASAAAKYTSSVDHTSAQDTHNERIFQRNLKRLKQAFAPVDALSSNIQKQLDVYISKQGFPSNIPKFIEYLHHLSAHLHDRQLIDTIEEKIHALQQVEHQLKQLSALGVL
ncbi:hypothetical protein COMNV_01336 [Commensalibacter sp. Nvir]|uniref:hypothetical protein n=1 Tax=Commensalibacter sp. Nvir TaxID=3069817 RepID=UPI002D61FC48|nr:hypothetical protein COMNV_01336 [Commensalibacter sp. Nvir]